MKREELIDKIVGRLTEWTNTIEVFEVVASDILALMPFEEIRKLCESAINKIVVTVNDGDEDLRKILSLLPEPEPEPEPKARWRKVTHGQRWQATDKDFWDEECQDLIFITTDRLDENERMIVWEETGEYGQFEDESIRKYCTLIKSKPEPKAGLRDRIAKALCEVMGYEWDKIMKVIGDRRFQMSQPKLLGYADRIMAEIGGGE